MAAVEQLITDNLDIWSSAVKAKSSAGRGTSKKIELYGIKKLRELILELAFSGKFCDTEKVMHDRKNLLKEMAEEKAAFHAAKGVRLQKFKPMNGVDSETYVPDGWNEFYFDDVVSYITDFQANGSFSALKDNVRYYDSPNYALLVRLTDLRHGLTDTASYKYTDQTGYEFLSKSSCEGGELVVANVGAGVGTTLLIPNLPMRATLAPNMFMVIVSKAVDKQYFLRYSQSPQYLSYIAKVNGGTGQPKINKTEYKSCKIPLPSLSDQRRIVAKVDELMALCDQLEQQQESSIGAHQTLVQTLLGALNNGSDREGFAAAWARIAEHFDTLFTTEWSIDQLKQTILQLAVMGKLVPQNPNDEPASELLIKIAAEKARRIREGKIKKQKPLPPISEEEKPFELPEGWEWVRVGQIAILKGGFAYKSKEFTNNSDFQVVRMGNIRPNTLRVDENPVFISQEYAESTSDYEIMEKDILLTMTGTKGKRDYLYSLLVDNVDFGERKLYLNQRLCIVRPVVVSECYINMVLKDDRMLDAIYAKSTGTANQANIGMDAILNWIIPLPTIEEQFCIINKVDALFEICELLKNKFSLAEFAQLKLADAISGFQ